MNGYAIAGMVLALVLLVCFLTVHMWAHKVTDRCLDVVGKNLPPVIVAIMLVAVGYALVKAFRGDWFNAIACILLPVFVLAVDPDSRHYVRLAFSAKPAKNPVNH